MTPIATLTMNPAVDKSARVDRVVPDDKLRCDAPRREPGGGGINVARVIQRLGGASRAFYPAGGPTGEILRGLLESEALDHAPLSIAGWTRENLVVYETSTDRQYRFGMPGPELGEEEVEACLNALRDLTPPPAYIVASGSLPPGAPEGFYTAVAEIAQEIGARSVLDTSGTPLRKAVRAGWYLLKPNLRELNQLAGTELRTEADRIEAARSFIERGWCEGVALSMGPSGALLVTADRAEHVRSPPVPIASRVGAGDSMVGGLVLALARGLDLPSALRFGVAAGAAAVTSPGTELCSREDTEALHAQLTGEQPERA